MKKKMVLCLMVGALAAAILGGCGAKNNTTMTDSNAESEDVKQENPKENQNDNEESTLTYPVLGKQNIEGYDGFDYLRYYPFEAYSGDKVEVYVLASEALYETETSYIGDDLGIYLNMEIKPFIRYDGEDYGVDEDLDSYLEQVFGSLSSSEFIYDMVISDAEMIDKDTARATVEYCEDGREEGSYVAVLITYLQKKLDDDTEILLEVKIDSNEVVDETEDLIRELEAFYQLEIDWSEEKAESMVNK